MAKRRQRAKYQWGDFSIAVFGSGETYSYVIDDPGHPAYLTTIRLRWEQTGPMVVGIEVHAAGTPEEGNTVSPRDVKRLPLSTYVQAATLHGDPRKQDSASLGKAYDKAIAALRAPRGRPERGKGSAFYKELAESYRAMVAAGIPHPAKEIARRKREDVNLVHQWIFRARDLGLLEPQPGGRRKGQ